MYCVLAFFTRLLKLTILYTVPAKLPCTTAEGGRGAWNAFFGGWLSSGCATRWIDAIVWVVPKTTAQNKNRSRKHQLGCQCLGARESPTYQRDNLIVGFLLRSLSLLLSVLAFLLGSLFPLDSKGVHAHKLVTIEWICCALCQWTGCDCERAYEFKTFLPLLTTCESCATWACLYHTSIRWFSAVARVFAQSQRFRLESNGVEAPYASFRCGPDKEWIVKQNRKTTDDNHKN